MGLIVFNKSTYYIPQSWTKYLEFIFTSRFIESSGCQYVKTKKTLHWGEGFYNYWLFQLFMNMIVVEVNLRNLVEIDKALRERAQSSDL